MLGVCAKDEKQTQYSLVTCTTQPSQLSGWIWTLQWEGWEGLGLGFVGDSDYSWAGTGPLLLDCKNGGHFEQETEKLFS